MESDEIWILEKRRLKKGFRIPERPNVHRNARADQLQFDAENMNLAVVCYDDADGRLVFFAR